MKSCEVTQIMLMNRSPAIISDTRSNHSRSTNSKSILNRSFNNPALIEKVSKMIVEGHCS